MFQYGNRYGHRPLRELLERRLSTLGIEARVNQIVLTFGANEALDIVIRGLMRFGDVALVDEPGYYPLYGKLQLHGVNIVGVRRNPDGPDVGELERLIKTTGARIFFTQSLGQNPTGSDTSPAVAFRMLQLAEKHDITLVESDPLADLKPVVDDTSRDAGSTQTNRLHRQLHQISGGLHAGWLHCRIGGRCRTTWRM